MENSGDEFSNNKFTTGVKVSTENLQIGYQNERPHARFSSVGIESMQYVVVPEGSGQWRVSGSGNMCGMKSYPLRNYTKDCMFFVHTGFCSFGNNCRFNHPIPAKTKEGQNGKASKTKKLTPVETCKFYLAGVCKNGALCRFDHTMPEPEPEPQKFNVIGLPVRLGETVCAYYMRTGMCGYGTTCKYHHPDPIFYNPEIYGPYEGGEDMEYQDGSSSVTTDGYIMDFQESTQPYYPSASLMDNGFQIVQTNYAWNGYQAGDMGPPSRVPTVIIKKPVDHPPQKENDLDQTILLNDVGLPRRPGKKKCWHYEGFGHCKFGLACVFDHPPKPSPNVADE